MNRTVSYSHVVPCFGRKSVENGDGTERFDDAREKPVHAVVTRFHDNMLEVSCPLLQMDPMLGLNNCQAAPKSGRAKTYPPCAFANNKHSHPED